MNDHLRLTYSSSIDRLCELNSSFDSGILKVAYTGKNRNGSFISKEAFERSISTIYNCPIVCNYNRERDEIGSHDVEIVMKDGAPQIINITHPVGVIPESAKYWFEELEDEYGNTHEYLCVEALVWKRQEAYAKIKGNVVTDESMEIRVTSGRMEDGIYVIDAFEFLAFCLLEAAEPCYESAGLELYSADLFRQRYAEMVSDFKSAFGKVITSDEVDIYKRTEQTKGGKEYLDKKMELLAKFGVGADQLDIDIEAMSLEELEAALTELAAGGDQRPADVGYALTGEQFREELIDALRVETTETVWGETSRYVYCDYDAVTSEVFGYDLNDWRLYGFTFSVNGDTVSVDFESKKRKKFSIVDFDEGDSEQNFEAMFTTVGEIMVSAKSTELSEQFETEKRDLESKFNAASDTNRILSETIEELRAFKQKTLDEERSAEESAVFAMFDDLVGIEAFEELKQNCSELSIEELEEKCYALRGRNSVHAFSAAKSASGVRVPIDGRGGDRPQNDEPYGGLFVEFPPQR